MPEQTFKPGDRIQYRSGNPDIIHPIGVVTGIINMKGNHHQKVIVQFGDEKPRRVYSNDYKMITENEE